MSNLMRYDFICKGKFIHSIDAVSEDTARAMFADSACCVGLEIIDVIEKAIPTAPVNPGFNLSAEGYERTDSEPKASAAWIADVAARGELV